MAERRLGIIMHGVTGRMGTNQHLVRSILAIREAGGVALPDGDAADARPDPGRAQRREGRGAGAAHGVERWTTDLDAALADPQDDIFFDAGTTQMRPDLLERAIAAGKHVYCEKPIADKLDEALEIVALAKAQGSRTAWCRTSCSCPACASSRC